MNIDNVVLVRVSNQLPINGELIPSCEGKVLKPDEKLEFTHYIGRIIRREIDKIEKPLTIEEKELLHKQIMEKYRVYTAKNYTSTLSFSLNGMVPDDLNNNFTNKCVAVIDPIKHHVDADFVNVDAIDTTIVGRLKLSEEAILVINEQLFNSLDIATKENLIANYKIELFNSNLREAVDATLKKYNYPSIPLIQSKNENNIGDCAEKMSLVEFENSFAQTVGASRLLLQDLYTNPIYYNDIDRNAHEKVANYNELSNTVLEYHKNQLYNFMIMKAESLNIEISEDEKVYLFYNCSATEEIMEDLINKLINAYGGINNFQVFIAEYNKYAAENYLTPADIIALNGEARK